MNHATVDRLFSDVTPEPNSGCWIWTRGIGSHGYGQVQHDARQQLAHRCMFEAVHGPIPAGFYIDHKCGVRPCINPDHLRLATPTENARWLRIPRSRRPAGRGPLAMIELVASITPALLARFNAKIRRSAGGCWLWQAATAGGYGRFGVNRRSILAHRFSYEAYRGAVPQGLVLDHLCGNRDCVNPTHLEAVTSKENLRRGTGRTGRHRLTHCYRGHEFTPENIYRRPDNQGRVCRECRRIRQRGARNAR